MREIVLTDGSVTIVDDADFADLSRHVWNNVNGYAARKVDGRTIYMHRAIMKSPDGIQVDHRNGRKLDNRRRNLRHATAAQNARNRLGWGASGIKGVRQVGAKWTARIRVNGDLRHLGSYGSQAEAIAAYNGAARACFGEFALLNDVS